MQNQTKAILFHLRLFFSTFFFFIFVSSIPSCSVGWGCRIHRLHLGREMDTPSNEYPGYNTKQSRGDVPITLVLWGLPSLPGLFWPGLVAPDRVLSIGSNRTKLGTYDKLNYLKKNCFWHWNCTYEDHWISCQTFVDSTHMKL